MNKLSVEKLEMRKSIGNLFRPMFLCLLDKKKTEIKTVKYFAWAKFPMSQ